VCLQLAGLIVPLIVAEQLLTIPLIPHHVQLERRSLSDDYSVPRRRERALQVGALYQGYGSHYVDLWVGTPPQRQTVIVDIGSDLTAFPCSGCVDCGERNHIDPFFQESQSDTFEKLPCHECVKGKCTKNECRIDMMYHEGSSYTAYESRDKVCVGRLHDDNPHITSSYAGAYTFPLKFGCQTQVSGQFKTQLADGIMGMDNTSTSFWNQMHDQGILQKRKFALCYSRPLTSAQEGAQGGALSFGGPNTGLHTSPMVYSRLEKGRVGLFSVRMRKVYLRQGAEGDSATSTDSGATVTSLNVSQDKLNSGGIIIDSGTTDTFLTRNIASAFNQVFQEMTRLKYGHDPVKLTPGQLDALPTILLQIEGDKVFNEELFGKDIVMGLAGQAMDSENPYDVVVAIPPSHYMEYDHKNEQYTARVYTDEAAGSVLGSNVLIGHDVFFDVENNVSSIFLVF